MSSEPSLCLICGKIKNNSAPGDQCPGHEQRSLKDQLDAIPTPGSAKPAKMPDSAPSTGPSLSEQLDAIPSPGTKSAPSAPSGGLSLSEQLDAIGTPGSGKPAPSAPAAGGPSLSEQLDSISTPGNNKPSPEGGAISKFGSELDSIPTPGTRPIPNDPIAQYAAEGKEVPEWVKKFAAHQASMGVQNPLINDPNQPWIPSTPTSYTTSSSGGMGMGYTMIIGLIMVICLVMFGFMIFNKPQAIPPSDSTGTGPSSTIPGLPGSNPAPRDNPPSSE